MCKAAEEKSLDDVIVEIKKILSMGTLKHTSRQVIYDAIRAAGADGLRKPEKEAIGKVSDSLGVSDEELQNIHALVLTERERERMH